MLEIIHITAVEEFLCAKNGTTLKCLKKWALEHGYVKGLTLDRENPDGDYCPENCKWATPKEQANNRRNTLYIEGHTVSEWAEDIGLSRSTISSRYYRGMPLDKIFFKGDMRCQD